MDSDRMKVKLHFILVAMVSFIICLAVTATYVQNKIGMEHAQMEQLALLRANKVNNVITKLLYKTQILSALVIQSDGDVNDFERVAATILDDPCIRNVILAPKGVVSNVYPLEGNERVIGLNYFSEGAGNQEAIAAKVTGQLVLGGPFELVQGGQALVGRLPVYIAGENDADFWGLVSVTLNYPQALEGAELEQLRNQGFAYEIWRISPDTGKRQIIANSSYDYTKNAPYVEIPIQLLNAEWYFRLSPIRSWYQYPETWIFSFCGLVISFLAGFLVKHNYELRTMKQELEKLTYSDSLTGALNRRGLFKEMNNEIALRRPFLLCFVDLNKFKDINDTFGHGIGDLVLQTVATVFQRYMNKKNIFARIGGDEFLLVFKDTDDKACAVSFLRQVQSDLNNGIEEGPQQISFSVGMAAYPTDAMDVDKLVALADRAMYEAKMNRNQI